MSWRSRWFHEAVARCLLLGGVDRPRVPQEFPPDPYPPSHSSPPWAVCLAHLPNLPSAVFLPPLAALSELWPKQLVHRLGGIVWQVRLTPMTKHGVHYPGQSCDSCKLFIPRAGFLEGRQMLGVQGSERRRCYRTTPDPWTPPGAAQELSVTPSSLGSE